jgi:hypothetical protein
MRRYLPLLGVTMLAAGVAFGVTQWIRHASCPNESAWLRKEFSLTDAQVAAIEKIRAEYKPLCAQHCGKLSTARERIAQAEKTSGINSPAYAQAQAEYEAINVECGQATRRHLEAIAAQMSPEEGRRYLELVGPKISQAAPKSSAIK